jgi:hypothetical protein
MCDRQVRRTLKLTTAALIASRLSGVLAVQQHEFRVYENTT